MSWLLLRALAGLSKEMCIPSIRVKSYPCAVTFLDLPDFHRYPNALGQKARDAKCRQGGQGAARLHLRQLVAITTGGTERWM